MNNELSREEKFKRLLSLLEVSNAGRLNDLEERFDKLDGYVIELEKYVLKLREDFEKQQLQKPENPK